MKIQKQDTCYDCLVTIYGLWNTVEHRVKQKAEFSYRKINLEKTDAKYWEHFWHILGFSGNFPK